MGRVTPAGECVGSTDLLLLALVGTLGPRAAEGSHDSPDGGAGGCKRAFAGGLVDVKNLEQHPNGGVPGIVAQRRDGAGFKEPLHSRGVGLARRKVERDVALRPASIHVAPGLLEKVKRTKAATQGSSVNGLVASTIGGPRAHACDGETAQRGDRANGSEQ